MSGDTLPIDIDVLVDAGDWPYEEGLARVVAQAV